MEQILASHSFSQLMLFKRNATQINLRKQTMWGHRCNITLILSISAIWKAVWW